MSLPLSEYTVSEDSLRMGTKVITAYYDNMMSSVMVVQYALNEILGKF